LKEARGGSKIMLSKILLTAAAIIVGVGKWASYTASAGTLLEHWKDVTDPKIWREFGYDVPTCFTQEIGPEDIPSSEEVANSQESTYRLFCWHSFTSLIWFIYGYMFDPQENSFVYGTDYVVHLKDDSNAFLSGLSAKCANSERTAKDLWELLYSTYEPFLSWVNEDGHENENRIPPFPEATVTSPLTAMLKQLITEALEEVKRSIFPGLT
jgi:hypothetical protein